MSAINSATAASGSQLATNSILMSLGQVYGAAWFTSRDVSNRLRLDFLYTSKLLSRMSRRPYSLLSVVITVARPGGGYENQYRISQRGWNKINYLRNHPLRATPANPRLGDEMWNANYLLNGKGTTAEIMLSPFAQTICQSLQGPSILDEVGMLLVTFDDGRLPAEMVNGMLVRSKKDQPLRLIERVSYLQKIGLVPADINPTLFISQARRNGSSESTILIDLLIRGGIKLRDDLLISELKRLLAEMKESKQTKPAENSSEEKDRNGLELDNDLTKKLEKALQEKTQLSNRNDHLKRHILNMSRCLGLVVEQLDKIKDPSPVVIAVKSFVSYALAGIVLMNYFAI